MSDLPTNARPRRSQTKKRRRVFRNRKNNVTKARRPLWQRRLIFGTGALVVLIILVVGGVFFYACWRFNQIPKVKVAFLVPRPANGPFNVLLVGSDSRSFVSTLAQAAQFGSKSETTGQRSDVTIVARVDPSLHTVKLLSIPRDTWVDIPGTSSIAGPNRINAAFNNGPDLLVETIERSFHIPINDYAEVNFPGFSGMVNALGGIGLDFPDPVKDAYSQLNITKVGCQLVNGAQALALVRSRHLYYFASGTWNYDGFSDWSRIQRQDAFFHALVSKVGHATSNPLALNSFLSATTHNIAIDSTLSEGEFLSLARSFHGFSSSSLSTETLPTQPVTINGQSVLLPVPSLDQSMIETFLSTPVATTAAIVAPQRQNDTLDSVTLSSSAVTVTTIPGTPATSPDDAVTNTQKEPWNPTPCSPK